MKINTTHLDLLVVLGEGHLVALAVEGVRGDGGHAPKAVEALAGGHDEDKGDARGLWSVYAREKVEAFLTANLEGSVFFFEVICLREAGARR